MQLKALTKNAIGSICEGPLLRWRAANNARHTLNIAYYHFVGERKPYYNAFYSGCTIAKFADDLKRLSKVFEFVPVSEIISSGEILNRKARPTIAISFDDGFDLRSTGVMDVLDRYRIKATTFVITSCLSGSHMMWRHILSVIDNWVPSDRWRSEYSKLEQSHGLNRVLLGQTLMQASSSWSMSRKDEWTTALWNSCNLPPLEEYIYNARPYFNWDSLREWISAGHSVGFHTHTHPYCSKLLNSDIDKEIVQPAAHLKKELGISDLAFSYPFGDRFRPEIESELFSQKIFNSYLGIRGFSPIGTSPIKLERVGIEAANVGWAVFGRCAFR